jgi:hypothetical protein
MLTNVVLAMAGEASKPAIKMNTIAMLMRFI